MDLRLTQVLFICNCVISEIASSASPPRNDMLEVRGEKWEVPLHVIASETKWSVAISKDCFVGFASSQ
jgi:hypothetical protein